MLLGISSYTYGWGIGVTNFTPEVVMTERDLIDETIRFNLKCLQLGDNIPWFDFDQARITKLLNVTKENDIRLELGARRLTSENLSHCIKLASQLGVPLLRFVVDDNGYEPTPNEIISIINEHKQSLQNNGITLGIENHDRLTAASLAQIIEQCNSDYVGICLDCVNSMGAGEGLEHVVKMLAPHTVNLHIKDFTIQRLSHKMGFIIQGTPAGTGMANIPWLLKEVLRYSKCQSAILEQWVVPEADITNTIIKEKLWAEESIHFLKSMSLLSNKNYIQSLNAII